MTLAKPPFSLRLPHEIQADPGGRREGHTAPLSLEIADPSGTTGRKEEKEERMEGGKEARKGGEGEKAAPCLPSPLPDLARAVSVADVWTRCLPGVGVAWPAVPQKERRSGEKRPRYTCSHCFFER